MVRASAYLVRTPQHVPAFRSMGSKNRRLLPVAVVTVIVLALVFLTHLRDVPHKPSLPIKYPSDITAPSTVDSTSFLQTQPDLPGHAIAPHLGNETLKAELGRASWKLFHTIFARFPDKPTEDESNTLRTYVYTFQRLYPCGECAGHFGKLLEKFPPQVSSRSAAAAWGCHVHNQVNKRLKKEEFDCSKIGDFYNCGCAEDDNDDGKKKKKKVELEKD